MAIAAIAFFVVLSVSVAFISADSEESDGAVNDIFTSGNFIYRVTVEDDGIWIITDDDYQVEVMDYTGSSSTVSIPTSVTGPNGKTYRVTAIAENGFRDDRGFDTVNIASSVTEIKHDAFSECPDLKTVTIPSSVTTIGEYAFSDSAIESVHLYSNVSSIGHGAFTNCPDLGSITVESGNSRYGTYNGILYAKDLSVVIACPGDYKGTVDLSNLRVTAIGADAFYGCTGVTGVTFPSSLTTISIQAFRESGVQSVTIPYSVTTIEGSAFYGCPYLRSVTISYGVTEIGDDVFTNCPALMSISVDPTNRNYSSDLNGILYNADKTVLIRCPEYRSGSIDISSEVETICDNAFRGCNRITSLVLPDSVQTIGNWAFYNCSALESITCPTSLKTVGNYAFTNCSSLREMDFCDGLNSIGEHAFTGCMLTSVTLPSSLMSIGEDAFTCVFYDTDGTTILSMTASSLRGHTYANSTNAVLIRDWVAPQNYDVVFNTNGGTNAPSTMSIVENSYFTIPAYNGTRDGYTFIGWSDGQSIYHSGDRYFMGESDIRFTAQWEPVLVESIVISETDITLVVGGSLTLTATVSPGDALDKTLRWSSSDSSVVTVSSGRVTAVSEGTAVITVSSVDGGAVATCNVHVTLMEYPVNSISLSDTRLTMGVGDDWTLTVTFNPSNATDRTIVWTSSDTDVVTVENGVVRAVGTGTAVITATTSNDRTATCQITVSESGSGAGPVDDDQGGGSDTMVWAVIAIIILVIVAAVAYAVNRNRSKPTQVRGGQDDRVREAEDDSDDRKD